ncbi:MAG: glycine oxidase ThiO [Hahellaceae bacterium]|nr:glycine oxidase ThiO [Hahellaceae bacterium]MCP5210642.1 glycine oxidase ThiO [Hahellaceae bacterium]
MKVLIIGGGAIGMMQARSLAQRGCEVTLIEKGLCGKEASWAGGGIVSPLYPWRYNDAVTALASWSQTYYANLAVSVEAESDIDPELCRHGLLVLSVPDEAKALAWGESNSLWLNAIEPEEIYRLEPNLREGVKRALYMPQVASIRNPRLMRALRTSLERDARVTIAEQQSIASFIFSGDRVSGVRTDRNDFLADVVVITAGAWSNQLLGMLNLSIPVKPIKGQMVLFKTDKPLVRRVVLCDGKYVIPRRDGRVLAGSTLEDCGFDKTTTATAKDTLTDVAIDMFPELASAQIEAHWAGLRPGCEDGIPVIGEIPQIPGLFINAGHFRNGLVLAPASVQLLTETILQGDLPFDPAPYHPSLKVTRLT